MGEKLRSRRARAWSRNIWTRRASRTYLDQLGFQTVGYGCTTCIGNSGPLDEKLEEAVTKDDVVVAAVLSGNRNFEGRVNPHVKANYLASPPLVVAFALAGRVDIDLSSEPLGKDKAGKDVFLRDIWPSLSEVEKMLAIAVDAEMYKKMYADLANTNQMWNEIKSPAGDVYTWDKSSTYIQRAPYFDNFTPSGGKAEEVHGGACARDFRRLDHDRSYFASGLDQKELTGRRIFAKKWRAARGVQLVRCAARQSRGDGARYLRQRAHQEHDDGRQRGRQYDSPTVGRCAQHLRCGDALRKRESAARCFCRPRVWHRVIARLGREGDAPPRCACGCSA